MKKNTDALQLVVDLNQSEILLRASQEFYHAILNALRENTNANGEPNLPGLFRQMNEVLNAFAPHAHEIGRLLPELEERSRI